MSGPSLLHQFRCFSHLLSQYLPQDSTTAAQEEGWGPLWEGESGIGHGTHQGREGGEGRREQGRFSSNEVEGGSDAHTTKWGYGGEREAGEWGDRGWSAPRVKKLP